MLSVTSHLAEMAFLNVHVRNADDDDDDEFL